MSKTWRSDGSADYKQHINLSPYAYEIIQNDMQAFMKKPSLSGFINHIIEEFRDYADASISISLARKEESLGQILTGVPDSPDKQNILKRLLKHHEKELLNQVSTYPKGICIKFRLNKKNFCTLYEKECTEENYYDNQGMYIKAIIEEYSSKSPLEREKIFFCERLIFIESCIKENLLIKLKTRKNWTYEVKPYAIQIDNSGLYHYLVGIASSPTVPDDQPQISSFRISLLEEVKTRSKSYRSGKITQNEVKQIEEQLRQKGVQFLLSNTEEIIIKLDTEGKKMFNSQLHLRPVPAKIDNDTYYFNCTKSQIEFYFFKFGLHAEIVEPKDLREKFISKYQEALKIYCHSV